MATFNTASAVALMRAALSTQHRPLRLILEGADQSAAATLLPQRVVATEAICGGIDIRVLCVSESATLALKSFIGVPAELQVVTDRGKLRRMCGIVTHAASGQSDGGLASYELHLRDALSVMDNKRNTRVFRNRNELEIVQIIIAEWQRRIPLLASTFRLLVDSGLAGRQLPSRQFIMQHGESDADFIRRLMQQRGIAWFFRAGLTAPGDPLRGQEAFIGHTLVLFDDSTGLGQNTAGEVRFHRDDATEQADTITAWSGVRELGAGMASLYSSDYRQPGDTIVSKAQSTSQADQGPRGNSLAAKLEDYRVAAPHLGENHEDLTDLVDLQVEHHEYATKWFAGEGSVRDMAVGEWFALVGHPEIDTHPVEQRKFVVTSQRIYADNNLPVQLGARVERLFERSGWPRPSVSSGATENDRPLRYQTSFTCVRRAIRIVPPPPTMPRPELQSAMVVGPENESVWCDRLGRVKVRFFATRPEDHEHADGAGSSGLEGDSAWVRVASSWSGSGPGTTSQHGVRQLPTVGTEVLIDFLGGHPDKPVIVGQLFNGAALPPAFVGEEGLPASRYQSGMRSREVRGRRGNQLRLDDTPGQISAQLASDHGESELNLGYLTEARKENRAGPRGEGAELRTEHAIALRAARGILLSAWKLLGGTGAKGAQLERSNYLDLLRECGELCAALGGHASEHGAVAFEGKEQDALRERFQKWEVGSNTEPDAGNPVEPVIALTSSSGMGFASSRALVSYSATCIDSTAMQHLQFSAGQRFALNAGDGISMFARGGGFRAISHQGNMLLQSQHDDIAVNSAKDLQVTASEGAITISGKTILLVAGDGSFLKLGEGAPVLGSKQPLKFHGTEFSWDGPQEMQAQLPVFQKSGTDIGFEPRFYPHLDGGVPATGLSYRIDSAAGASEGSVDAQGAITPVKHEQMHLANIELREEEQP